MIVLDPIEVALLVAKHPTIPESGRPTARPLSVPRSPVLPTSP